jgi:outer membrane protein OmpA-like peptidoglycan-associated protein
VEIFESVAAGWDSAQLEAFAKAGPGAGDDAARNQVSLGEAHEYGFETAVDAHLVVVHLDPHGVATVLLPAPGAQASGLGAGAAGRYPLEPDLMLLAEPPLGQEDVFVFATPEPVSLEDLGFPTGTGTRPIVDVADVVGFSSRVRDALAAFGAQAVAASRIRSRVVGRATPLTRDASGEPVPVYTVDDVVNYFTSPRTRSIRRPVLDVHIQFELDSAKLTEASRRNLDVVGEALASESLGGRAFEVGGHTCDLGPEAYNLELSRRRADSVRRYLSDTHEVDAARLVVQAYGESRPLEVGTTEAIRSINRRVEFALVAAE